MRRRLVVLAGTAVLAVLPALPAAAVPNPGGTGSPGAVAPESYPIWDREVFETGPNGDVVRWRVGDSPTTRYSIGGYATSGPAAALRADGWTTVVVRGRDGAVWLTERQRGGPWPAWRSLGGATTDRPAIDSAGTVYVRGTDGVLWIRTRTGAWQRNGRPLAGGPGVGAVRDADGRIWTGTATGWVRQPAMPGGVRAVSEPSSTWAGVLVRGSDGQCWALADGTWLARGGQFIAGFSGVAQSDGVGTGRWIYGRGTNGKLYVTGTFHPPGWTPLS